MILGDLFGCWIFWKGFWNQNGHILGVRKLMKIDLRDISQIFGNLGVFGFFCLDFGFFGQVFWNQNGNIVGVQKADEN